ncbi:MAG TPA: NAD(P)/FAD-dependent oxidoreductase [Thermoanaerobaculia bacterium]|nr:NAD(P)/FAD-dependent oxidoreductase [Thermoanaerobaculia bacterium]
MRETFDAVVVGAGPAGSVAAHGLARRGRSVLLLDRSDFPRDKVCGDALVADSLRVLARLGLTDEAEAIGQRTRRLRALLPDGSALELACEFLCATRRELDDLLRRAAVRAGAEFRGASAVTGVDVSKEAASLCLKEGGSVRARLVLVATGAASPLLDLFEPRAGTAYDALAARSYFRLAKESALDRILVAWDRSTAPGYGWLFPLRDGLVNVGCGVFLDGRRAPPNLSTLFTSFTAAPEVAELLRGAEEISPLRGASLRCGMRRLLPARDRLLAVGEAQGATLPFSGEGIGKAMETAELAAEHADAALAKDDLSAASLSAYTRALTERLAPRYRAYETAQRWVRRPALVTFLGRRARKSAYLRTLMSGLLDESTPPDAIFSPLALVRSYFG